jgi:uncharacterized protein
MVKARGRRPERFDAVFLACHSDQALRCSPTRARTEREVLGAIPYQENAVVLHTDTRCCRAADAPGRPGTTTSRAAAERVGVTYNMNILQGSPRRRPSA